MADALSATPRPRDTFTPAPANPSRTPARQEQPADRYVPSQPQPDVARMQELRQLAATQPRPYQYGGVAMPDLRPAQQWQAGSTGLSGTDANARINDSYHKLDGEFSRWMGGPPVANWMTFGKYASREAGEQIRNLEDVQKAATGDPVAAANAARNMADVDQLKQAALLGAKTTGDHAVSQNPLLVAASPTLAGAAIAGGAAGEMVGTMGKMRDALVEGNTEIYQNVAPAYDAFLKGESPGGKGGMQALKDAGYTSGSAKDPQGFVTGAFDSYTKAKQKGLEAEQATDPAQRQVLLDERKELMNKGNLQIGLQEQMVILQRPSIFGDPAMQKALGAIGGTMSLTDANGKHDLRPDGKSWAGFADRMGLKAADPSDPSAIKVKDHDGKTSFYVPDSSQKGTIFEYFTQNVDGPSAKNLMQSAPRPLVSASPTFSGQGLMEAAQGVRDRDAGKVAGGLVRIQAGVLVDGASWLYANRPDFLR